MKKKSTHGSEIIVFNTTLTYIIPMMPSTNKIWDYSEEPVEVKINQNEKGVITVIKDGYQMKSFDDRLFEFLLYTKYIRIK